jgi:probable DNA metabolism protein
MQDELFEIAFSVPCPQGVEELLKRLEDISSEACAAAVYALLSLLPVETAVSCFLRKVLDAAERSGKETEQGRAAAKAVWNDLLDPETERVRNAAAKTARELDRMKGLLRFSQNADGLYTAYCASDHFVLPLLANHFLARFGEEPWEIIDEKRGAALIRERGKAPGIRPWRGKAEKDNSGWEKLWKNYHRAINNEDRTNPGLQRQFMPKRYWKHLPEMD